MRVNQLISSEKESYYFSRVKDTYKEDGEIFITLFARLKKVDNDESVSVWADIEEVKWVQASEKLKKMPDGERVFSISKEVFLELKRLSATSHEELYALTPIYKDSSFRQLR